MRRIIYLTAIIFLLIACGKESNTIVTPYNTKVKGDLGNYISIVEDRYEILKQAGGLDNEWQISFKLKKNKEVDLTNATVQLDVILVNSIGKPVVGKETFKMATGLWDSTDELEKFKLFLKSDNEQEEWFTLNMNTFVDEFKEELPDNATHFEIRTVTSNINSVSKQEDNSSSNTKISAKIGKEDIIGLWVGDFGKNTLELKITEIVDNLDEHYIKGINTVKNNSRDVLGDYTITKGSKTLEAVLEEPGDNKYDGVFHVYFDLEHNTAKGNWRSNNGKLERSFSLMKKGDKTITNTSSDKEQQLIEVSNSEADNMIDKYENYVKEYVSYIQKIEKGDLESYNKSITLMNKANRFYQSIEKIDKSKFTVNQINRLNQINMKMLTEVSKAQSKL